MSKPNMSNRYHENLDKLEPHLEKLRKETPDNPACMGWSSYSQCDEDGIIRECLERIGKLTKLSKTVLEIGCGNGRENNSHQLILDKYKGYWIDGSPDRFRYIEKELGGTVFPDLKIVRQMVDRENAAIIASDVKKFLATDSLDLFSLDIDGNDIHVCDFFVGALKPKLICVEYNAKYPPPTVLSMDYNPVHVWDGGDYFGSSLQAWVEHFKALDYTLVCCNLSGANAFFVKNTFLECFTLYTTSELFQHARYNLVAIFNGHPASLSWLKQVLTKSSSPE